MSGKYEKLDKKKKEYLSFMELNVELAIKLQKEKSEYEKKLEDKFTKFLKEKNNCSDIP